MNTNTTNETVINQIAGNLQKIIDQQLDRDYPRPKYWVTWMIDMNSPKICRRLLS